jgi:hypothetical protein
LDGIQTLTNWPKADDTLRNRAELRRDEAVLANVPMNEKMLPTLLPHRPRKSG